MSSKLDRADAQEWLESLQQVGEGWWRQVALAVKAGAPKALGMDRKVFAQTIGQRLIDPREAIIELHNEGHSKDAIADILGVSKERAHNVLVEEGIIEGEIRLAGGRQRQELAAATADSDTLQAAATADPETLQAQIDALAAAVKGEQAKARREADDHRKQLADLRKKAIADIKAAREEAEASLTDADRDRLAKEASAWAEEQGRKILVGISHLVVESIVGNLEEAAAEMRTLIEQQAITPEVIDRVGAAHTNFLEEFNVARMTTAEARR